MKVVIGFIEFLIFKNESQAERADIFKGKLGHKSTNPRPLGGGRRRLRNLANLVY